MGPGGTHDAREGVFTPSQVTNRLEGVALKSRLEVLPKGHKREENDLSMKFNFMLWLLEVFQRLRDSTHLERSLDAGISVSGVLNSEAFQQSKQCQLSPTKTPTESLASASFTLIHCSLLVALLMC